MSTLQSLLSSRLERFRRNADGSFQARCPCCAARGGDKSGEHLRVYPNGAFHCVVGSDQEGEGNLHNKAIRAFIYTGADPVQLALMESAIVDPDPKLTADPVYPEEMLTRALPDHRYWQGRGISDAVLRAYEGGLVPPVPRNKLSGRYVFPIRDHVSKRIMGWSGRLVDDASFGPSWKHLVKSKRAVYPLTVSDPHIKRARKLVLVESIGDMLSCAEAGIPYTLVLLGLNLNSRMLGYMIGTQLDEIIISTNTDKATENRATGEICYPGQEAAAKLRAKLVPYLGEDKVKVRLPTTANDWNDVLKTRTGELELFRAELEGKTSETETPIL